MNNLLLRRRALMGMGGKGEVDYSLRYLTIEPISDCTIKFSNTGLHYSTDDGSTWTELPQNTASDTITAGNAVLLKGPITKTGAWQGLGTITVSGSFNAFGNILSLLHGDNFAGGTYTSSQNGLGELYSWLFSNNRGLVSAENLVIPPIDDINGSAIFHAFFYGCSGLVKAPNLSTRAFLNGNNYRQMFYGCSSLTEAPEMPILKITAGSYLEMFKYCTNLRYVKAMFTEVVGDGIQNWLQNVSPTGTFVKNSAATWENEGIVPSGWTIEYADN